MKYRISIDVGGTFTDMVLLDEKTGNIGTFKTITTPFDLTKGILNDIKLAADNLGISISQLLNDTISIVHGTTATTNALIEGKTGKVGVITTKGFRDILHGREGGKEQPFKEKFERQLKNLENGMWRQYLFVFYGHLQIPCMKKE